MNSLLKYFRFSMSLHVITLHICFVLYSPINSNVWGANYKNSLGAIEHISHSQSE